MAELKYKPVPHDHEAFLQDAQKREGFQKAYEDLKDEYALIREMLTARSRSGLTQKAVAELMGTTKSSVSRPEAAGEQTSSLATIRKYAQAVGCQLQVKLIPHFSLDQRSPGGEERPALVSSKLVFPLDGFPQTAQSQGSSVATKTVLRALTSTVESKRIQRLRWGLYIDADEGHR